MIFPGYLGGLTLFLIAASVSASGTCVQIDPQVVNAQRPEWSELGGITFLSESEAGGPTTGGSADSSSAFLNRQTGTLSLGNAGSSRDCICVQLQSGGLCYWLNAGDSCTDQQPSALSVEFYQC